LFDEDVNFIWSCMITIRQILTRDIVVVHHSVFLDITPCRLVKTAS